MRKINWGILATGEISKNLAISLNFDTGSCISAVASRKRVTAERFAKEHHIQKFYSSYIELIKDPEIDIIYIGTPNPMHFPLIKECLENNKPVLCEKPFTLNAKEAKLCIELAQHKELFLMEAMWTRFFPVIIKVKELIDNSEIGEINFCRGSFHVKFEFDPTHRVFNPVLGGGALLDIGVYPISLSNYFLGIPESINGHCQKFETQVDFVNNIFISYSHNKHACVSSGFNVDLPREFFIGGTKGFIKIHDLFFKPHEFTLQQEGKRTKHFQLAFESNGYVHMVRHVNECLRRGLTESPIMPHKDTLEVLKNLDTLRKDWNIVYPQERNTNCAK